MNEFIKSFERDIKKCLYKFTSKYNIILSCICVITLNYYCGLSYKYHLRIAK